MDIPAQHLVGTLAEHIATHERFADEMGEMLAQATLEAGSHLEATLLSQARLHRVEAIKLRARIAALEATHGLTIG